MPFKQPVFTLTVSLPKAAKVKIKKKLQISFSKILKKKIRRQRITSEEVSFEWSHHRF